MKLSEWKDIDERFGYDGFLGVRIVDGKTEFYVWAPTAESVKLLLYKSYKDVSPYLSISLEKGDSGVWKYVHRRPLKKTYYCYEYTYNGYSSIGVDPYACAVGINGEKGYICKLSELNPNGWDRSTYVKLQKYTDAVLYEAHVRNFSSDPSSGINSKYRGKFKAFTINSSRTPGGKRSCVAHLRELGITHVHLLPVFDYDRLDETNPRAAYNWGYDPKNYNAPEGSYCTDPFNPELRITELKELVMSLHEQGIGVVMDVVYNHTYLPESSNLGKSFPSYYYRYREDGKLSNGSGCGNEIASDHAMVRKYIVDSVLFWAKEYKIDGFRFDLMACLDVDTLNEITRRLKELNPNAILYGEGWSAEAVELPPELAGSKVNSAKMPEFAYFNDNFRDAIKGAVFSDSSTGYVSGNYLLQKVVCDGLLGITDWAVNPRQVINYCEAHDNLTLWDKLTLSVGDRNDRDRRKMARLCAALVLLAQGVPFIHAGQEFLRSKPLGDGKFDHNSYASPDSVNSIKWGELDKNYLESEYITGLISFRKAHHLLRMATRDEVMSHSEILPSAEGTIAIHLYDEEEELLIFVNPIPRAKLFALPNGEWRLCVSDCTVSENALAIFCEAVYVPPISVMVLKKF